MSIIFVFVFMLLLVPLAAFYVWTLIDALRTPAAVWERAEQNQILWVGVIVFASLIGAVAYMMIARPQLLAARDGVAEPASMIR